MVGKVGGGGGVAGSRGRSQHSKRRGAWRAVQTFDSMPSALSVLPANNMRLSCTRPPVRPGPRAAAHVLRALRPREVRHHRPRGEAGQGRFYGHARSAGVAVFRGRTPLPEDAAVGREAAQQGTPKRAHPLTKTSGCAAPHVAGRRRRCPPARWRPSCRRTWLSTRSASPRSTTEPPVWGCQPPDALLPGRPLHTSG